jgi:O-antigen ligase
VGSTAFLFFLFLTLARFHEFLSMAFGGQGILFWLTIGTPLAFAFVSGRWVIPWKTVPGVLLLALTVWVILGLPFSIWRGGAAMTIKQAWPTALVTYLLCGSMITTIAEMRKSLYVGGFSVLVVLITFLKFGVVVDGRASILAGSLGNSNDFAMHLLMGLPFLGFIILDQKRMNLVRLIAIGTIPFLLVVVMKTGSRAGLLGLAVLLMGVFFFSSMAGKVKLLIVSAIAFAGLLATAPESALKRYKTIYESDATEATASADSRKQLLVESIRQTILHPIFGLGPGNFMVAYAATMGEKGVTHGRYLVSHNTYAQVASETGLPGFFMFCGVMFWTFRQNLLVYRIARRRPDQQLLGGMALAMFLSLLTFSVTTFFGSNGYRFYVPFFAGMTVSLRRIAEQSGLIPGFGSFQPATTRVNGKGTLLNGGTRMVLQNNSRV